MKPLSRMFILLLLGAVCAPARAEWSVHAQLERFRWREDSQPRVKEMGARGGLGLGWTQDGSSGFLLRYRGTVYAGSVKYDGATLVTGTPVQGTTDYSGMVNELHALYRPTETSFAQIVAGLGVDYWQRSFPTTFNQQEDWRVVFLRIGLETGSRRGLSAAAGVKYPVSTEEKAHLQDQGFDQNPPLHPGKELSVYADLGYRFSPHWRLAGYYDSYRFAESRKVTVTQGTTGFIVWQPRSTLDVLGLRVEYFF